MLTMRTAVDARVVHNIQEKMPETVLIAALVKGTTDCHNLLGSWRNSSSQLHGVESLLLPLASTKHAGLWLTLLSRPKKADLLLILLLWLLRRPKYAWLALLQAKAAAWKVARCMVWRIYV